MTYPVLSNSLLCHSINVDMELLYCIVILDNYIDILDYVPHITTVFTHVNTEFTKSLIISIMGFGITTKITVFSFNANGIIIL